jgi:lipocalin
MFLKPLLPFLILSCSFLHTQAQRVKRKGVTMNEATSQKPVAKYSLSQLEGKWQEVKRIPAGAQEPTTFTDTILMKFYNDKAEVKYATSMTMGMKGPAQIDAPNSLVAAGDFYTIRSLDKNQLIVDDGEFTREFHKTALFYYEMARKAEEKKDSVPTPVSIDISNLKGKWFVYARKAEPGAVTTETLLIKSLEIVSVSEDSIAFGQVVLYTTDASKVFQCQVVTKDGLIKIITEKNSWSFYAYKADGKEFIFGETGKLVYYAKH